MYYLSGHRCVRKDLIEKELSRGCDGFTFKEHKLSKKYIDWLFRHYLVHEFTIHFYDSEPQLRDDIEYDDPWWETSDGKEYVFSKFKNNEENRLTFRNWIDVFGEGIWYWSQNKVDKYAREMMTSVRNWPVKKHGRIFAAYNEDTILIYCYGRDFLGSDYWWIFHKK